VGRGSDLAGLAYAARSGIGVELLINTVEEAASLSMAHVLGKHILFSVLYHAPFWLNISCHLFLMPPIISLILNKCP
jgi:hypothetical protein